METEQLRRVAAFASHYDAMLADELEGLELRSWRELRTDWWLALRFLLSRVFQQGRRVEVADRFWHAALKALESLLGADTHATEKASRLHRLAEAGWFQRQKWNALENCVKVALQGQYPVITGSTPRLSGTRKARDREMVLDTSRFLTEHPAAPNGVLNLVDYSATCVTGHELVPLYHSLLSIRQVGPKVAALFLRDLICVLGLTPYLRPADYGFLQPVDTWVRQLATRFHLEAPESEFPARLAEACVSAGVDPIRLNQGAWYLGARAFDVLLANLDRIEPRPDATR